MCAHQSSTRQIVERFAIARDGFYPNELTFGEHTGTHLDGPIHFIAGGLSADRIPVDRLFPPLAVVSIKARADKDADATVKVDMETKGGVTVAIGVLGLTASLTACGLRHPAAVRPAPSPRRELIEDMKAFEQMLGVGATGNFLRYSDGADAVDRCYFTGQLELPVSYRGLQLTQEVRERCAARENKYDVFFYPVEAVASGSAAITPALAEATVERVLVVVPHEDFHSQPEARKSPPEIAEAAATLAGFLTASEFARAEYGETSEHFQRLNREARLFLRKAQVVNSYYDRLSSLYQSFRLRTINRETALARKAAAFAELQRDCSAITPEPASFNRCPAVMNNAGLAFERTYAQYYSMMFDVYLRSGEDAKSTIGQLKQLLARPPPNMP
jgi:putative cyclase/putative aminopeptidase